MIAHVKKHSLDNQSGLTLIELVVSIVIMGIIGLIISHYMSNSVSAYIATKNNITALEKLRLVNARLNAELREVNHNGTNFDIDSAFNSTTITFTNIDTVTTVQIDYDGTANVIKLDYANPAVSTLSDNITSFSFSYYQADGSTAATPGNVSEIVFVEYSYTLNENGISYSSTGRVMLRDRQ